MINSRKMSIEMRIMLSSIAPKKRKAGWRKGKVCTMGLS